MGNFTPAKLEEVTQGKGRGASTKPLIDEFIASGMDGAWINLDEIGRAAETVANGIRSFLNSKQNAEYKAKVGMRTVTEKRPAKNKAGEDVNRQVAVKVGLYRADKLATPPTEGTEANEVSGDGSGEVADPFEDAEKTFADAQATA
jgi:hypothetical protein